MKKFNYPKMPAHVIPALESLANIGYGELARGQIGNAIETFSTIHSVFFTWNGRLTSQKEKFINRMNGKLIRLEIAEMRKLLEVPKKDQSTPS